MESKEIIKIEGNVENIVFRNEDSGFTVLELEYNQELLTAVGEMVGVEIGERLVLHGNFISHHTYGFQFKVSAYERSLPKTANAIAKYLASGAVKGIGPVIADRLVNYFGDETLEIMEKQPQELSKVQGISPRKAQTIAKEFSRIFGIRLAMMFLAKYDINASVSIRIWKKYGEYCKNTIEKNPYVLCSEDIGLSFEKCDSIAQSLGIKDDNYDRVSAGILYVLRHNIKNGHTCIPVDKLAPTSAYLAEVDIQKVYDIIENQVQEQEIIIEEIEDTSYAYLPNMYEAEQYVANRIKFMLMTDTQKEKSYVKQINLLEKELDIKYEEKQKIAIEKALNKKLFILTGGPGTGKTTIINAIIRLCEDEGDKVALAAPTGRAAQRMAEVTGKESKTIHRLLEVDPTQTAYLTFKRNEKNPLSQDVIIIDEMSMVDINLMQSLIRAIKMGARLILVGDDDQLPSVGAGNVLKDMIQSNRIQTVHLTEIFRQAAQSLIVTNAHRIVKGQSPIMDIKDNDFFFMRRASYDKMIDTVKELIKTRLPSTYGFSSLWDIQIITPTRVGPVGANKLNEVMQQALNPKDKIKSEVKFEARIFREGDKVMQTKNNYDVVWTSEDAKQGTGVYNGDIGIIDMIDKATKTILIKYCDKTATYSFENLDEIEHAYAITVHKSQGSEFEAVIFPLMHYKSKMHYRNLLYTAVTRARKMLITLGIPQTIETMVQNNRKNVRYTNLLSFIKQEDNNINE